MGRDVDAAKGCWDASLTRVPRRKWHSKKWDLETRMGTIYRQDKRRCTIVSLCHGKRCRCSKGCSTCRFCLTQALTRSMTARRPWMSPKGLFAQVSEEVLEMCSHCHP